ncbi:MAG TPA: alpha/beta hydrolase [Thermoanaerobaculia bacterium]|jgi:pimeloyl-ACP methyl ester carboxylesterase
MLHYVSEGTGPLVVLLHGFPEFWYSWRKQIPALAAAGFRAVAPDLPGYGESPKPPEVDAYTLPRVSAQLIEFLETLNEPCVLVGHDWGGFAAWFVAMTRPDLVRKLVICNVPHPVPLQREVRRSTRQKLKLSYQLFMRLPVLPELFMKTYGPWMMKRAGRFTKEDIDRYRAAWRGSLRTMVNYYRAVPRAAAETRRLIKRIDVPTMMIWGIHDPVFLPSTLEGFSEWVPNLRIERVKRAGHFVQTDAPERVNELLIEFAR